MMESTIEGELQSLGSEGFEGWAWDSGKPYDPVEVEVICNGVVIARTLADGFSLDLVKQRKGNGMHTFSVIPETLPRGDYPLNIWARVVGQETALAGQLSIRSRSEFIGILPKPLLNDYKGYIDGIRDGMMVGWVFNLTFPEDEVEVELLDGDRVIATALASRYRGDVQGQHPEGGNSGFELPLTYDLVDGRVHSLRVRVVDSGYELANSPVLFGPSAANTLITEILRIREVTSTLDKRLAEFPATFETLARELLGRFEAFYSIQRDAFERELQEVKKAALGMPTRYYAEPLPGAADADAVEDAGIESDTGEAPVALVDAEVQADAVPSVAEDVELGSDAGEAPVALVDAEVQADAAPALVEDVAPGFDTDAVPAVVADADAETQAGAVPATGAGTRRKRSG